MRSATLAERRGAILLSSLLSAPPPSKPCGARPLSIIVGGEWATEGLLSTQPPLNRQELFEEVVALDAVVTGGVFTGERFESFEVTQESVVSVLSLFEISQEFVRCLGRRRRGWWGGISQVSVLSRSK